LGGQPTQSLHDRVEKLLQLLQFLHHGLQGLSVSGPDDRAGRP
jgi:hypothetical protein